MENQNQNLVPLDQGAHGYGIASIKNRSGEAIGARVLRASEFRKEYRLDSPSASRSEIDRAYSDYLKSVGGSAVDGVFSAVRRGDLVVTQYRHAKNGALTVKFEPPKVATRQKKSAIRKLEKLLEGLSEEEKSQILHAVGVQMVDEQRDTARGTDFVGQAPNA